MTHFLLFISATKGGHRRVNNQDMIWRALLPLQYRQTSYLQQPLVKEWAKDVNISLEEGEHALHVKEFQIPIYEIVVKEFTLFQAK